MCIRDSAPTWFDNSGVRIPLALSFMGVGIATIAFTRNSVTMPKIIGTLESVKTGTICTEDIRREINLNAIEFKTRLNRIEGKIDDVSTLKNVGSNTPGGVELIAGVILGLWSGIMGSICVSAMFEIMKITPQTTIPLTLLIVFFAPLVFLIGFTYYCWKFFLDPISKRGKI